MTFLDDEERSEDGPVGWLAGIDIHHCVCVLLIAIITAFAFPPQPPLRDVSLAFVIAPLIAALTMPFTFLALAPWNQGLLAILRYLRDNFFAGTALTMVVWLIRFSIVAITS